MKLHPYHKPYRKALSSKPHIDRLHSCRSTVFQEQELIGKYHPKATSIACALRVSSAALAQKHRVIPSLLVPQIKNRVSLQTLTVPADNSHP